MHEITERKTCISSGFAIRVLLEKGVVINGKLEFIEEIDKTEISLVRNTTVSTRRRQNIQLLQTESP